jgi:alkanesulfonate monooxygenase SsuD/methylene tetrahydromethanopterin reductase-like flavin-dependent oxidoreductase (luciferase family)
MEIGVVLSPTGDWPAILAAAKAADQRGLSAVGFWDHYHSEKPEWAYVCGWSAYGALAASTERIRLVPMVLCRLSYTLGVLAKESAILSIASGGRFDFAIGAGDYPPEYAAWHQPFPSAAERIAALAETIEALRMLWGGGQVTYSGAHVQLTDAACTPIPPTPPRVVVGVGGSRRLIASAAQYADELNLYGDPAVWEYAEQQVAQAGRAVDLSVFLDWGQWPDDIAGALAPWRERGATRAMITIGWHPNLVERVHMIADALS